MLGTSKSSRVVPPFTPVSSPFLGFTSSSSSSSAYRELASVRGRDESDCSNEKAHDELDCQEYRDWELPSISCRKSDSTVVTTIRSSNINHHKATTMKQLPPPPPSITPLPPTPPATRSKSTTSQRMVKPSSSSTSTQIYSDNNSSAGVSANRFTDAQRDRTLRHHKLIQPTPIQEKAHLIHLYSSSPSQLLLPQPEPLDPHPMQHRSMIEYPRNASSSCLSLLTLPEQDLREEGEDDDAEVDVAQDGRNDDELSASLTVFSAEEDASHASSAFCEKLEITYENHPHEKYLPMPSLPMPRRSSSCSSASGMVLSLEKDFRRMSTMSTAASTMLSSSCSSSSSSSSSFMGGEDGLSEFSPTTSSFVPGESSKRNSQRSLDGYYGAIGHSSKLIAGRGNNHAVHGSDASTAASTVDSDTSPAFVPLFCQPCNEMENHSTSHRFVVCADTQFGITAQNKNWDAEADYSMAAVDLINSMTPRPSFVCVCGDLVDMEYSFEKTKGTKSQFAWYFDERKTGIASRDVCDSIQDEQNEDFKKIWSRLHPDIALVCLCGNHDVGNRPTPRSISRFRAAFGDEYLAFWANGTYNIVLNNVLFVDHSRAKKMYSTQLKWLEDRLKYAQDHQAKQVYVFAHHPWFLYDEDEDPENLTGASPYPDEWKTGNSMDVENATFPDSYFSMPKRYRVQALELFRKYNVDACFSGHFHQNLISRTSWGCDMIVTAPLSVVFESTGKQQRKRKADMKDGHSLAEDDSQQDFRRRRKMTYESEEAMMSDSSTDSPNYGGVYNIEEDLPEEQPIQELNCRGVRVVDVHVNETAATSGFSHWFVPL